MKTLEYVKLALGVMWIIIGFGLLYVFVPNYMLVDIPPLFLLPMLSIIGGLFLVSTFKKSIE